MKQTKEEKQLCECIKWARTDHRFEHHKNCPKYNPAKEWEELCSELLEGMKLWASDEDGVHYHAWEAYKKAMFMCKGLIPTIDANGDETFSGLKNSDYV